MDTTHSTQAKSGSRSRGAGERLSAPPDVLQDAARTVADELKKLGWQQGDLADRCGVHRTTINKFIKGKAGLSIGSLRAIAAALKVPVDNLVGSTSAAPDIEASIDTLPADVRQAVVRLVISISRALRSSE